MTRITYDVSAKGDGRPMLNFETKEDAKAWIAQKLYPTVTFTIKPRKSKSYRLGEHWRSDFDYNGMIKMGSKAKLEWGEKKLNQLFDSYEDVNYHSESDPLYDAIQFLKSGDKENAERKMYQFRRLNQELLNKWNSKTTD